MINSLLLLYPLAMTCADPKSQTQQSFKYTLERKQVIENEQIRVIITLTNHETGHLLIRTAFYDKPNEETIKWRKTRFKAGKTPKESVFAMREILSTAHLKLSPSHTDYIEKPVDLAQITNVTSHFNKEDAADIDPDHLRKWRQGKTTSLDKIEAVFNK